MRGGSIITQEGRMKKDNHMLEEIKRHVGVVVEGLRSEVRIIAEQYGDIMRKLEEHDVRFDRIDLDLKGMKIALFDNSHRLNDHDARIRKLETR